jgi:aminocarboxymuconate-semialdehyde decarboxylase
VRVVDVHAHVIPPALVDLMRTGSAPDGITLDETGSRAWVVHRQGYRYPLLDAFHDVSARLSQMDSAGTDLAVLSVAPPLFLYWTGVDGAAAAARTINDAVGKMVEQAPHRFAGLATLPMQDPVAAAAELRRCVSELGMRGAQIGPHIDGTPLDDESLLFGSDVPFDMAGGTFVEQLDGFPGSDDARDAVASGNADRLFALNGDSARD